MRRQIIKFVLFFLFVLVFIAVGFYLYINFRTGKDYTADLSGLMPPDTILFLSLRNLPALIKTIDGSDYVKQWREKGAFEPLLRKSKRWEKWQKKKQKYAWLIPYNSELEFIERWMGKQLVMAIVPTEGNPRPQIILASQTKIGFEEKLGGFVLENYPELRLKKERYAGRTIVQYQAEKERRGFCYTLFGRTVVLSLRSPEPQALKRIINTYHAGAQQSILATEAFKRAVNSSAQEQGLMGYINLQHLPELITAFKKKVKAKDERRKACLKELLKNFEYGVLRFKPEKSRLHLRLQFFELSKKEPNDVMYQESEKLHFFRYFIPSMPVKRKESLCWMVSQPDSETIQTLINLALLSEEDSESTSVAKIREIARYLGESRGAVAIGFFITPQNNVVNIFSLFSGLIIDVGWGLNYEKIIPQFDDLMRHIIEKLPSHWKPIESHEDKIWEEKNRWWRWQLPFPFMAGYYGERVAIFSPTDKFSQISDSLRPGKRDVTPYEEVLGIIREITGNQEEEFIKLYAEVDLKRGGEALQNISSLANLLTKDEEKYAGWISWGKIIQGFNSGKIFLFNTRKNEQELHFLLECKD